MLDNSAKNLILKALEEFFDNKIARNTDILESTKHLMDLISDRSIDLKLKNRIVESFLFASDSVSL